MIWIKKQKTNPAVTGYYLDTIGKAYKQKGEETRDFYSWNEYKPEKNDITVIATPLEVFVPLLRRKKFVFWFQGIRPEESYSVHKSSFKKKILEIAEKIILKKALFMFFVSDCMKEHYIKKYGVDIDGRYYTMPCSNEVMHEKSFDVPGKYDNNVFCYAGSINSWQCVEETLRLYKNIESTSEKTKLLMLVKDRQAAEALLEKYDIKNYEIDFVPIDRLEDRLRNVKFGFIVREDIELNRVATPTKMSTYMVNGIIPIISDCLVGLNEIVDGAEYVVRLSSSDDAESIKDFMSKKINSADILAEYQAIYKKSYNRKEQIRRFIDKLPLRAD